ncbi:hypothetical protein DBV15_00888 [Temnothorax longispinosus]|uniref:Uncharacterized protein n=1 Tax=Temnothorax longispinosus TaxID=300112 RepID=A0A4S2JCP6_9HYME|nr:hypothetical protein DBV15_00888 [Temnothorax longispinosus]
MLSDLAYHRSSFTESSLGDQPTCVPRCILTTRITAALSLPIADQGKDTCAPLDPRVQSGDNGIAESQFLHEKIVNHCFPNEATRDYEGERSWASLLRLSVGDGVALLDGDGDGAAGVEDLGTVAV